MRNLLKYIFPKEFHGYPAYLRGFILGMFYLAIVILQLFTFEKFADVTRGYGFAGGMTTAAAIAGGLVLIEVSALPYLISMRMSQKWRRVAECAVIGTPIVWLLIALWLNLSPLTDKTNTGLFGATIATPVHVWLIAFASLWLWAAILVTRELPARYRPLRHSPDLRH